ncbi:hypothetical protein HPB52_008983 [Rhipicephalus sanguineus]|uniref:CRAL-TRIO domain-containing protein n=1 Tax=Rhipicephalus sanguineus TaxID=34632 RepID=A0A9D4T1K7_RHISA|nr:hypothetical protein HPB52_008983 [Rhipicephalus sanguineus]
MCSLTDLTRCLIVLTESHLTVEETQIGGFDCLPLRTEKIYVVNNPSIFALLFAAAKPFLHKKLLSRIELLGSDIRKLQAVVPADVISKRHGGTLEDFDYRSQETFMQERSAYFEQMDCCSY